MSVDPSASLAVTAGPEPTDLGPEADQDPDRVTKCGRCRLSFVRHPSIVPGDSPRWWLCPPCRSRLLGDESKTNARWGRSDSSPRRGPTQRTTDLEVPRVTSLHRRDEDG
jgi:hypothetical protein